MGLNAKYSKVWGYPNLVEYQTGDGQIGTTPGTIHTIILQGTSVGDKCLIYNANAATAGWLILDLVIDVAQKTIPINFVEGIPFSRDIYIDATDTGVNTTVVWTPN